MVKLLNMSSWSALLQHFTFFLLLSEIVCISSFSNDSSVLRCNEAERKVLLEFKKGLSDPWGKLSSWHGKDCCSWEGVGCSKNTGNVVKLDLRSQYNGDDAFDLQCLTGTLSPYLLRLKHLRYLDLSMNDFQGNLIPEFIGSLKELRYINLSHSGFSGMVPPQLGNLSNLIYLDLSSYILPFYTSRIQVGDLEWLSGLYNLKYLNLGSALLKKANSWLQAVHMLPFLSELHMYNCELPCLPMSLPNLNFTSLSLIDLSYNDLKSNFPNWLFKISTLVYLDLSFNHLNATTDSVAWEQHCNLQFLDLSLNGNIRGDVSRLLRGLSSCANNTLEELRLSTNHISGDLPYSLSHFKYLRSLLLNENLITGSIPTSIKSLSTSLRELDLSYNRMSGIIPESVGKLVKLNQLKLYHNRWKGVLSENILEGLIQLEEFAISSSDGTFHFYPRQEWLPRFSLQSIELSDFPLGPKFPIWLRNQTKLSYVVLRNASISQKIPDWFWKLSLQIETLDLSHNQIKGELPISLDFSYSVDLSFNQLKGSIPVWPKVVFLYLGNNSLSGSIPLDIGNMMSSLRVFDISANLLSGSIPLTMPKLVNLITLDLSKNNLTGNIPNNWAGFRYLESIDLSNNKLSGVFPGSLCSSPFLEWMKLCSNNLSGELFPVRNCTKLSALDLKDNRFTGNIPEWLAERLLSLSELNLRNNLFSGNIPKKLCSLSKIHILDFAQNNLSGFIPHCLGNLSSLISLKSYAPLPPALRLFYAPRMDLFMKGGQLQYAQTLELVNIIDLSSNNLQGEVPRELTNLLALGTLNLSRNQLTGQIPEKIGSLQQLETLDLSSNNLHGPIPSSMSSITSLSHLNLSHNNLSGPIPSTNQFLTFTDPSIYEGNPQLCGSPLQTKCQISNHGDDKDNDQDPDEDEKCHIQWFYLSTGLGFFVGFWIVCGSLVIKKSWRYAYFQFTDKLKDWILVTIAINLARLRRACP